MGFLRLRAGVSSVKLPSAGHTLHSGIKGTTKGGESGISTLENRKETVKDAESCCPLLNVFTSTISGGKRMVGPAGVL